MLDKSAGTFPIKRQYIYLAHCGISPLYSGAVRKETEIVEAQRDIGALAFRLEEDYLEKLRSAAGKLLGTSPENLAFVKNTSEGIGMIANGYPFKEGDQIISYVHEYPANHYPWRLQELRGVELILLPNRSYSEHTARGFPCAWSISDLEKMVTDRTKIVAISHVQFTSGFAADLKVLGVFCRDRGIDLVVDAAQSLGCLPVYPEEYNISAVASSGWKWLLGPVGTGLLYTSEAFRAKIRDVLVGADCMVQGTDYLDHTWQPYSTARRFEYSTSPLALAAALHACIAEVQLRNGLESITKEVFRLQELMFEHLDKDRFKPLRFPPENRSGILSVVSSDDPLSIVQRLEQKGVICSSRGGYLRLAPHFYNTDEEVLEAVRILNSI